jgi:hypothetical protein
VKIPAVQQYKLNVSFKFAFSNASTLYRYTSETALNRKKCKNLVEKWSRPVGLALFHSRCFAVKTPVDDSQYVSSTMT